MNLTDTNKIELIEQHYASFWVGDLDDFDVQLSDDFLDASAPSPAPPGPASVKEFAKMARSLFGQMRVTIDDAMVDGNVVVVKAKWRRGDAAARPEFEPGAPIEFGGIVVWELDSDGRICRRTAFLDPSATAAIQSEVAR